MNITMRLYGIKNSAENREDGEDWELSLRAWGVIKQRG